MKLVRFTLSHRVPTEVVNPEIWVNPDHVCAIRRDDERPEEVTWIFQIDSPDPVPVLAPAENVLVLLGANSHAVPHRG